MGVHLGVELHLLAGHVAQARAQLARGKDEQRQDDHADHGQPPVERDHHHQQCHGLDDVGDDVDDRVADGVLRPNHIVVQAAHQLADLGVGEEAQRHALQAGEERHPQVVDDALAHRRIQPPLDDSNAAADAGHHQQGQASSSQPLHVPGRDDHVDHAPEDERREQGEAVVSRIATSMPTISQR